MTEEKGYKVELNIVLNIFAKNKEQALSMAYITVRRNVNEEYVKQFSTVTDTGLRRNSKETAE